MGQEMSKKKVIADGQDCIHDVGLPPKYLMPTKPTMHATTHPDNEVEKMFIKAHNRTFRYGVFCGLLLGNAITYIIYCILKYLY